MVQLHNHIAAAMKAIQTVGPDPSALDEDAYKTFTMAAGVPFLQAFQLSVRRACVAGKPILNTYPTRNRRSLMCIEHLQ